MKPTKLITRKVKKNRFDLSINVVLLLVDRGKMSRSEMADEFGFSHYCRQLKKAWKNLERKKYVQLTGHRNRPDEHFAELLPYTTQLRVQENVLKAGSGEAKEESIADKIKKLMPSAG